MSEGRYKFVGLHLLAAAVFLVTANAGSAQVLPQRIVSTSGVPHGDIANYQRSPYWRPDIALLKTSGRQGETPARQSMAGTLAEGRRKGDRLSMPGARVTWVIGGAVLALVVVAGVDALRSPDDETSLSAMTAATTTEGESGGAEAPCRPKQIAVSIDIRKPDWRNQSGYVSDDPAWKQTRVATVVVRNVGSRACDLHEEWHLVITDRRGHVVATWRDEGLSLLGRYAPGSEKTFSPSTVYYYDYCNYPGPYVALARVGLATPARRDNLSASEITC